MNRDRGLLPPVYDSSKHQNPPGLAPCVTVISVFFFPPESSVLYLVLTSGCFVCFILLMFLVPTEEDYSRVVATNSISFVQLVVIGTIYLDNCIQQQTNTYHNYIKLTPCDKFVLVIPLMAYLHIRYNYVSLSFSFSSEFKHRGARTSILTG